MFAMQINAMIYEMENLLINLTFKREEKSEL